MNAKKLKEIEFWLHHHDDEPLSYEVQQVSRNVIMVMGYVPHEYPETDEGAEYFFGETILYIEERWDLGCQKWGWDTDYTYYMYFYG